jgi:shikimate dehydrogenase
MKETSFKTYCIIGDPINSSLSPVMQNAAFGYFGLNNTYIAFKVPKGELKASLDSLRATNAAGFNVTIPHKIDIVSYLDELHPSAQKAGAVNTVNNIEGIFKGFNTDIYGFIEPLRRRRVDLNGMKILLIGAGGAARAIIAALSDETGISALKIANRTRQNAEELVAMASNLGLEADFTRSEELSEQAFRSDLIINSTPIGMANEQSLVDREKINKNSIVYDLVYRPMVTRLIENAKQANASVVYGYEMLLAQGARAFEIWTGMSAPMEVMKKALLGRFAEPS